MMRLLLLLVALFIITGEVRARREGREAGADVEEYASYVRASSPILITAEPHSHQHHRHQHHHYLHNATATHQQGASQAGHETALLHFNGRSARRRARARWKQRQHRGGRRAAGVRVVVEGAAEAGPLPHFWRSTGLSPPLPHSSPQPFLLSPDELLNLAMVGSLPHQAISQARIHWLFGLVNATLSSGAPQYNFTQLDTLMTHLHQYRLSPGFELMGNPGGIFTDLENATQVSWWRLLVGQTAARYVELFGLDWVSTWRWETWNEPDHHDFDNLSFTVQGFLNYFEACRAGLLDVSPRLRLGGPGGSCRDPSFSRMCWALLDHCDRRAPARCLDYISVHKKGQEDADSILTQELLTSAMIRSTFTNLRHVPLVNDEGDFLKGWWRGAEWRADSRYAALVVRAVAIHLPALAVLRYELLSFDNAFLNYRPSFFNQRTLVARFQMNSTSWRHVQLVKKPAYAVMGLLSLLGDRTTDRTLQGFDDRLSVIASCRHCRSKVPTSLPGQKSHDHSGAEQQTGGDVAEPDHDLHVYPSDNSPETEARSGREERDEETKEGVAEEEKEGEEEEGIEEAKTNIPSSLLNHKHHDPTLNLLLPNSRRNTRRGHTHADRKRGSTVDAKSVGEASVAATGPVFGRGRPRLHSQASHTQRLPSTGIGEDATAVWSFETNEGVAASPRPEEGGNEGGRREMVAGVENEEIKEDTAEREENDGGIEEWDGKNAQENENGEERREYNENTEDSDEIKEVNGEKLEQDEGKDEKEEKEEAEKKEQEEKKGEPPGAAWEAAVLVSLSDGPTRSPPGACRKVAVEVNIPSFLLGGVMHAAVYRLRGSWPGPYEAWQQLGRPEEPSRLQLAFMRTYENPRRQGPIQVATRSRVVVPVRLCAPDVWLLHLCQPSTAVPGQVVGVAVTGVTPWDALVTWADLRISTRCVLRYEVEHSGAGRGGPYIRVSRLNITDNNFWHALPQGQRTVRGWYRVRVITYWGSTGPYSFPVYHRPSSTPPAAHPSPSQNRGSEVQREEDRGKEASLMDNS
ncbi:alpha-L-iduronidase-like isoform X2 [Scylla paramamosain]|uniref:alpha-L-iduronidase-like isoform X2 n=1 Tax=Scylla paramamosain TaxID=85552 RepID=UPI0030831407